MSWELLSWSRVSLFNLNGMIGFNMFFGSGNLSYVSYYVIVFSVFVLYSEN